MGLAANNPQIASGKRPDPDNNDGDPLNLKGSALVRLLSFEQDPRISMHLYTSLLPFGLFLSYVHASPLSGSPTPSSFFLELPPKAPYNISASTQLLPGFGTRALKLLVTFPGPDRLEGRFVQYQLELQRRRLLLSRGQELFTGFELDDGRMHILFKPVLPKTPPVPVSAMTNAEAVEVIYNLEKTVQKKQRVSEWMPVAHFGVEIGEDIMGYGGVDSKDENEAR